MKIIGLTGGVGSGKSTVAKVMEERFGSYIIIADEVGHNCMKRGEDCYQRIVRCFGRDILDEKEELDREKLSNLVFNNPDALSLLNSIVHPCVQACVMDEIWKGKKLDRYKNIVIESAILLEVGYEVICDEVWYISASEEVRRKRLSEIRGYSKAKIDQIIKNQMSDTEFLQKTIKVLNNNKGIEEIIRQLEVLLE